MKLDIVAKELYNGYVWTRGGISVYRTGGIYIVSCFDFQEGFDTIKECKNRIKEYFKDAE